jgi:hypothetical protein
MVANVCYFSLLGGVFQGGVVSISTTLKKMSTLHKVLNAVKRDYVQVKKRNVGVGHNKLACLDMANMSTLVQPLSVRQGPSGKILLRFTVLHSKIGRGWICFRGSHDTQHNDTQHNDTQYNDTQHNDTRYNDTQHNDTQYNDTQYNDTQHKWLV